MKIALDYDQTYTADPEFFEEFILLAKHFGHDIVVMTYRDDQYDWTEQMSYLQDEVGIPVYCTRGVAKEWWSEHFGPGKIDIWIDDNVKSVHQNSSLSSEALAEWRKQDPGTIRPAA